MYLSLSLSTHLSRLWIRALYSLLLLEGLVGEPLNVLATLENEKPIHTFQDTFRIVYNFHPLSSLLNRNSSMREMEGLAHTNFCVVGSWKEKPEPMPYMLMMKMITWTSYSRSAPPSIPSLQKDLIPIQHQNLILSNSHTPHRVYRYSQVIISFHSYAGYHWSISLMTCCMIVEWWCSSSTSFAPSDYTRQYTFSKNTMLMTKRIYYERHTHDLLLLPFLYFNKV